jgi:hypothetical protein
VCVNVSACACVDRLSLVYRFFGDLVPPSTDFGFGFLDGFCRRPAGRTLGHMVDEVDLDMVGHLGEGAIFTPHVFGIPPWRQRFPPSVPLSADYLLHLVVTLIGIITKMEAWLCNIL